MAGKFFNIVWNRHESFPFQSIVLAWLFAILGFYLGNACSPIWFARFGSITVLFGVIAEYALLQKQFSSLYSSLQGQGAAECGNTGIPDLTPKKWDQTQSMLAHLTVVFGTLIWGFGDWLLTQ